MGVSSRAAAAPAAFVVVATIREPARLRQHFVNRVYVLSRDCVYVLSRSAHAQ